MGLILSVTVAGNHCSNSCDQKVQIGQCNVIMILCVSLSGKVDAGVIECSVGGGEEGRGWHREEG